MDVECRMRLGAESVGSVDCKYGCERPQEGDSRSRAVVLLLLIQCSSAF